MAISRARLFSKKEFDGIIVIDELELHLHPEWQTKIYFALQEIFPNVQFIITTHSPHIVQSAKGNKLLHWQRIMKEFICERVTEYPIWVSGMDSR